MAIQGKTPSSLAELKKLVDSVDDGEGGLEFQWLDWVYNFLTARKAYHKKQQMKKKMMMRVASEYLSQDELEEIERQAEALVEKEAGE